MKQPVNRNCLSEVSIKAADSSTQPQIASCCHGSSSQSTDAETDGHSWVRTGIALVLAGQSMVFGLGYNMADPRPAYGSGPYLLIHGGLIVSALVVLFLLAPSLVREALTALRRRQITVEGLFILSVCGAFTGSLITTFSGEGDVYYEVVAILLAVYTIGKMIGARSREQALQEADRIREDYNWAYEVNQDGSRARVPVDDLCCCSSRVSVRPGEPVTVDGTILTGTAFVRETAMTGEPVPVVKRPGDAVLAGSYPLDGELVVKPSALLGERQIDAILATVEGARMKPSALQQQADRIMQWFLPVVVTISVATLAFWLALPGVPWWEALFNSMAVLLVACPCALGLATPIAVWGGILKLSANGLVVCTGDFIDRLAQADCFVFDKTGTLSEEQLMLVDFVTAPGFEDRRNWLKDAVTAVEQDIEHPVAKALSEGPATEDLTVVSSRLVAGEGVRAEVKDNNGRTVELAIGELTLMPEVTRKGFSDLSGEQASHHSKKQVYIAVDGSVAAMAVLDEKLRDDIETAIIKLKDLGLFIRIMTGDREPRWQSIGGVPVEAGLTPAEKERRVTELLKEKKGTIFVGDGINDAGAMTLCPGSVAMGGGAALARSTSAAVLMGDDISLLPEAVQLCRRVRKNIRGNLVFAACYNFIGMALAASGFLHPVVAALLMVGSSAFVSYRALRSVKQSDQSANMPDSGDTDLLSGKKKSAYPKGLVAGVEA